MSYRRHRVIWKIEGYPQYGIIRRSKKQTEQQAKELTEAARLLFVKFEQKPTVELFIRDVQGGIDNA